MNIILFDELSDWNALLPFTYTRPISGIRVGILRISEKWELYSATKVSYISESYLQQKFPAIIHKDNMLINGTVCPSPELFEQVEKLEMGESLIYGDVILAFRCDNIELEKNIGRRNFSGKKQKVFEGSVVQVKHLWDVFSLNGEQIKADFAVLTRGRKSQPVNDKATVTYNEQDIFIEEGAKIRAAVLNAETGPIYIGKNADIQEGALIKGPFAICEESIVGMGGKMRPNTTIGPFSRVGGEISNSVIFGYSNKSHDGFIGNTVIGEWCNLGADTNTSNMKNNLSNVKIWSYAEGSFVDTGRQFCGLFMGDHSKCGINTMFNTGTVVGVSANIYGGGFPSKFIASYSWGGSEGFQKYDLPKALEVAERVMDRRGLKLDDREKTILRNIYQQTV